MSSNEENSDEYVVEEIRDHICKDGVTYYLIKWQDYDSDSNTWEPLENLNCPDLLKEYKNKIKEKKNITSKKATKLSVIESKKSSITLFPINDEIPSNSKIIEQSKPTVLNSSNNEVKLNLYQERNDEMIHEEFNDQFDSKEEFFTLVNDSESDEYETDDEDEFDKDFLTCFNYPESAKPCEIISTALINNKYFYMIQFDDEKVYYIELDAANKKCEEIVDRYHKKRLIGKNIQFRKY